MSESTTYNKALRINLDESKYGSFAEIGAGQEVANWFFRAPASAGTVAKSMSAYDMTMSDEIYGKASRYVSRQRLLQMLSHEYSLLDERLSEKRGDTTRFFSFCNTVRARGYQDTGECHGWLGIRLQLHPKSSPCDILMHVRLLDLENTDQMEALGVVGTNMIYAALYHLDSLDQFVDSLLDNLAKGRVEVDMLKFEGKGFEYIDNRLCHLQLVQKGLTDAAMFLPTGEVVQPAEVLYKKPIILLRGSFDPVLRLHLDMLDQSKEAFLRELGQETVDNSMEICEISMNNLLRGTAVDHRAFLDRADALQALGKTVLVSNCPEFHRIGTYLRRYTSEPIGIVLSIGLLNELFKEKWSENLAGGILESFGRLFKQDLSLLIYPWKHSPDSELVTATSFKSPEKFEPLYRYFLINHLIHELGFSDEELLLYTGRDVTNMIHAGDAKWRKLVPKEGYPVVQHILEGR
ncbi:TonB-dependent receptor [Persicirhabdus sediminis]|uniref:TonB-dependent receptor n=1 Tax=Persicirhabdus sediminis TaxID=454144 RepID=A0A8J7MEP3_9BACT|nr:TonB-dependent receptor [Persicirhabdus sediminis]MBK1791607.1 TonB-dependent receptor [Persicirhabdus sediminis]